MADGRGGGAFLMMSDEEWARMVEEPLLEGREGGASWP